MGSYPIQPTFISSPLEAPSDQGFGPPMRRRAREISRSRIFRWAIPIWLMATFFSPALDDLLRSLNQGGALALMFLVGLCMGHKDFVFGPAFREDASLAMLSILFAVTAVTSALLSENPPFSLGMFVAIVVGMLICAGLWQFIKPNILEILATFATLGTGLVGITYSLTAQGSGRFMAVIHPNQWGSICFGLAVSALAVKRLPFRLALIAVNVFIILQAQARGSFAALTVALTVYAFLRTIRSFKTGTTGIVIRLLLVSVAVIAAFYFSDYLMNQISDIFHLYDRERGLDSGFTGRRTFWEEALELFREHPVLGLGPRMLEDAGIGHNGYLSVLGDVGLVGSFLFFPIIVIRTYRLWKQSGRDDTAAAIGLALVAGYLFFAIFERCLLNVGNPTSLLAWMFLLEPKFRRDEGAAAAVARPILIRIPTPMEPEQQVGGA